MNTQQKHTLNRRRLLALLGGAGASAILPAGSTIGAAVSCAVSTPQVTEGPYWVEEKLFRSDIRTDPSTNVTQPGVPLVLNISVINSTGGNCVPLANAWVDIWHCDATGIYSDEPTYNPGGGTGNVNTKGQKFLRGYQLTDATGSVQFTTIYPGWYASRTIHIHLRIRTFTDSTYTTTLANYTTQFFFDDSITNTVLTQATYARTSPRDTTNATDSVYNGASNKETMLIALTQTASGYTANATIDASLLAAAATTFPAITTGGIANAASGVAGVTPGAWTTIYGTNLASTTYTIQSSDIVSGYLPTQLQGVSVQIDGKAAFLDYVSPTQINVLAPADTATGQQVSVSVTNSSGVSNSVSTVMQSALPGLFAQSGYVLAVRPSDSAVINGTGAAVSGYSTSAAAKANDVLELFGTGFGSTQSGAAPGQVFSGSDLAKNAVTVTIGGKSATVLYAGLVGAGLWQINVQVPAGVAAGDNAVIATVSGFSSPSSATLKITA